jgi:hypothetical protein
MEGMEADISMDLVEACMVMDMVTDTDTDLVVCMGMGMGMDMDMAGLAARGGGSRRKHRTSLFCR